MDDPYEKGIHSRGFLEMNEPFDTVHFHILFGKAGFNPTRPPFRRPFEKQAPHVQEVIQHAKKIIRKRMIFSDYHQDATVTFDDSGSQFKIDNIRPKAVLLAFLRETMVPFQITEVGFSAGEGCPDRDIHVVADK